MTASSSQTSRKSIIVFIVIAALALSVRLGVVIALKWNNPNADEAVAGLMAKHIAEGIDYPVFFYGQSYFGALESYVNAGLIRLIGFDHNLIYAMPVFFSLLMLGVEYKLAQTVLTDRAAKASVLVLAVAPATLTIGLVSAAGGFGLAVLLELLAIWLYLSVYSDSEMNPRYFLGFCLVSGLLFWVWQIYILIFVGLCVLLISRGAQIGKKWGGIGLGGFLLMSAPLWIYNLLNGGETFIEVFGRFTAADANLGLFPFLQGFVGNRVWNISSYTQAWIAGLDGGNILILGVCLVGIALNWRRVQIEISHRRLHLSGIALLLIISLMALLAGHRSIRYLYILPWLLIPCGLAGWQHLKPAWLVAITMLLVGTNLLTDIRLTEESPPEPKWTEMLDLLKANQLGYGYSDFWNAYPLTFLSGEKIIVSPRVQTPDGEITDRYPAYSTRVNQSARVFILIPDGSRDVSKVEQLVKENPTINLRRFHTVPANLYWPLGMQDAARRWLASR